VIKQDHISCWSSRTLLYQWFGDK